MNNKTQLEVGRLLDKVVAQQFDQDDISLLLVKLRQFIKSPLLKEIAHYIAHPDEKNQGISHREIDLGYHKIVRVANQRPNLPLTPLTNDFMDLWLYGIAQTEPAFAKKYFGGDRQQAKAFVEAAYEKQGSSWELRALPSLAHVQALSGILHGVFNSLKAKPLFTQQAVIRDLRKAVEKLNLSHSQEYSKAITSFQNEVTACAMCAIQHAPIRLRDGTPASLLWGAPERHPMLELYAAFRIPYSPPPDGHLDIHIVHFTADFKAADYIEGAIETSMILTAKRCPDGRLVLAREK